MTIQQLNYIITIAETGSMNKAAEKLYIAQPSLTSAVQELEKEIGVAIFIRGGRGVTLTPEGMDFLRYAKNITDQVNEVQQHYGTTAQRKKKFGVSSQHYSFVVKAFVELAKEYDTSEYELAMRETMTKDVIYDVANHRSEIGILYLDDFNRSAMTKLIKAADLDITHLTDCKPYVYLWAGHPLAKKKKITFDELQKYPCLSFEQGDTATFYHAEEILSTKEYKRVIKANDRATMLNLMKGLNGYTLCSGIVCEELNGEEYIAVPFELGGNEKYESMEIIYITRRHYSLSTLGKAYIEKIKESVEQ